MASNYVLSRPGEVQLIPWNTTSASGAKDTSGGTILGSVRSIELTYEAEARTATSTANNDAVVATLYSTGNATLTIEIEEITDDNLNIIFDGSLNASGTQVNVSSSGGAPQYYSVYAEGFYLNGTAAQLAVRKASARPGTTLALNNEQQIATLTMDVMYDPDASAVPYMFSIGPVT